MKRYYKKDWIASGEDTDVDALKAIMEENISRQDDPELGIFWYDTVKNELFGVRLADLDGTPYRESKMFPGTQIKTPTVLHYRIWEKEFHKNTDSRFKRDYTTVPRGRIFYVENRGFVVVVGDWIDKYPQAKEVIQQEFNLPDNTEFLKDTHWNIGHGRSDRFI